MADDVVLRLDAAAIRAFEADPPTRSDVLEAGRGMALTAAALAPRATGGGAASIAAEPSTEDPSAADVSWDQRHFYMIFQEDGTRYVPARHFLRDAFDSYIHT